MRTFKMMKRCPWQHVNLTHSCFENDASERELVDASLEAFIAFSRGTFFPLEQDPTQLSGPPSPSQALCPRFHRPEARIKHPPQTCSSPLKVRLESSQNKDYSCFNLRLLSWFLEADFIV